MKRILLAIYLIFSVTACAASPRESETFNIQRHVSEFPVQEEISILRSDQDVLSEKKLKSIFSDRVVLPKKGHLAIIKVPSSEDPFSRFYGNDYWLSESYHHREQEHKDLISRGLLNSNRIIAVTFVPSLLTAGDASISVMREASTRLQADLLLVYKVKSALYKKSTINNGDMVKAFSICEALLLDIRTGLIPYTTSVTRESSALKQSADQGFHDAERRAEESAVLSALGVVADEVTEFLRSVPQ